MPVLLRIGIVLVHGFRLEDELDGRLYAIGSSGEIIVIVAGLLQGGQLVGEGRDIRPGQVGKLLYAFFVKFHEAVRKLLGSLGQGNTAFHELGQAVRQLGGVCVQGAGSIREPGNTGCQLFLDGIIELGSPVGKLFRAFCSSLIWE